MDAMLPVAQLLDQAHSNTCYQKALQAQKELFEHAELTPSAQVLTSIMNEHDSYYAFARHQSQLHRDYFMERELNQATWDSMEAKARDSLVAQAALEAEPQIDFDLFLKKYFAGEL
jgi:glutamate--cysteine ligase